jgi:hypothetical protein
VAYFGQHLRSSVTAPPPIKIQFDKRPRSIPREICRQCLVIAIQVHCQRNLADNPDATANAPAKAVLVAPIADCGLGFPCPLGRPGKVDPFPHVIGDQHAPCRRLMAAQLKSE